MLLVLDLQWLLLDPRKVSLYDTLQGFALHKNLLACVQGCMNMITYYVVEMQPFFFFLLFLEVYKQQYLELITADVKHI